MEGLYLYCIRKRTGGAPVISSKSIDENEEVFVLPFHDLEAVVSKVSLEEFDSEAIRIKAQNDLKWIKEKAIIHEQVIEEAMGRNGKIVSLIPAKFGTIFKEEKKLKEILNNQYDQFEAILEKLKGKQEWSIKVYLVNRKKLEVLIKEESKIIKERENEIASLPEGMAYFMESELKELLEEEMNMKLKKTQEDLFERFNIYIEENRKGEILEREITGRSESMILNASYLIREEKIEDFKIEADRVNNELNAKGLSLEYTGPWPPYSFAS